MQVSKSALHRFKRILLIGLGSTGIIICALSIGDKLRVKLYARKLASGEPRVRERALKQIAQDREGRAAGAVFALLERETHRDMLEKTGYAAMRLRDVRAVPFLRKRAESSPDDITRAKLLMYAARVSNRDLRLSDWLRAGTVPSSEPWLRAGSALALLELGCIEGGEILTRMAPELDPAVRDWALKEFRTFADPMVQTAGQRIEGWDKEDSPPPTDSQVAQYRTFWQQYASVQLLSDVLQRRERLDDRWRQLNRLLHARQRLEEWLN